MDKEIKVCVSTGSGLSFPFKLNVGLKQGCNLSPLLFNIFINDVPDLINLSNCDPPKLVNLPIPCLLYADDLVLLSKSREGLQNAITKLGDFSKNWFLEVNELKTKCLIFAKGKQPKIPKFKIGKNLLSFCDEYCYLGIIFSKSGNLNVAAKALSEKATGAMFSILKKLNKYRSMDHKILIEIFEKMITPIALYGVEVWGQNFVTGKTGKNDNFFDRTKLAKNVTENIQYRFLKNAFGST